MRKATTLIVAACAAGGVVVSASSTQQDSVLSEVLGTFTRPAAPETAQRFTAIRQESAVLSTSDQKDVSQRVARSPEPAASYARPATKQPNTPPAVASSESTTRPRSTSSQSLQRPTQSPRPVLTPGVVADTQRRPNVAPSPKPVSVPVSATVAPSIPVARRVQQEVPAESRTSLPGERATNTAKSQVMAGPAVTLADTSETTTGRIIHAPSEQPGVPDEVMVLTDKGQMLPAAKIPTEVAEAPSGARVTVTNNAGKAMLTDFDATSAKTAHRAGNDLYRGNRTLHVVQVIPKKQVATPKTQNELRRLGMSVDHYFDRESGGQTRFSQLRVHPVTVRSDYTCENLANLHHEVLRAIGLPASWNGLNVDDKINVIAVMPRYSGCPGGRAYVGYGFGYVTNGLTKTMIHEVSHQLGLRHAAAARCNNGDSDVVLDKLKQNAACTFRAYGDRYDVMGNVANLAQPAMMTPSHAQKLGFLITRTREISPGTQHLSAYADQQANTRALTYRDSAERATYHIFYRSAALGQDQRFFGGLNTQLRMPQQGVVVTKTSWDNPWGQPILVERQPASRYWDQTLPLHKPLSFAGGKLVITVQSLNGRTAQLHATVRGVSGPPPAKQAAKITTAPVEEEASAGRAQKVAARIQPK